MSAYYATGGPGPAVTSQHSPAPVLAAFAGPAPQSRLTVLFRIFMVIPQLVVLWLLGIAAMVVVIIGWFGALFTGRLPVFAADFLTGYLRWLTRVYAYLFLLTDVYPPFSLDDADYPVRVAVAPGRLNRLAVLFRYFLLIPCWIVAAIVGYGAFTIVQFVSWLIVLISGQMPEALYQALAAALRYQIRTLGFALMLTSAYPAGLFGDPDLPGPWTPAGPPTAGPAGQYGPAQQPGYGVQPGHGVQPGYGTPEGYGDPQGSGAPEGYGDPHGYGDPQGYGGAQPGYGGLPAYGGQPGYGGQPAGADVYGAAGQGGGLSWRLILSGTARKLVVGFLVLGVLFSAGVGAIDAATIGNGVNAVNAANQVQRDIGPVRDAINNYSANVQACHGQLTCVTSLDRRVAATLNTSAGQLGAIPIPSRATAADAALAAAVSHTASIFARLGTATSVSQYNAILSSAGLRQAVDQINQAYTNLGNALGA